MEIKSRTTVTSDSGAKIAGGGCQWPEVMARNATTVDGRGRTVVGAACSALNDVSEDAHMLRAALAHLMETDAASDDAAHQTLGACVRLAERIAADVDGIGDVLWDDAEG